ncbi:hypothetical protein [Prescottella sp. R16]|uniref:hypothetical protein n=1 Tax=Prescottella sp. R16 TaxID=3064529 RepID=UPI00272EC8A3|nr:hypothetical protein [Prescottella sp. R16]
MALVYRAIWSDRAPNASDTAAVAFAGWVKDKSSGAIDVSSEGLERCVVSRHGGPVELEAAVSSATGDGVVSSAYRATLAEASASGVRWQTTLRSWDENGDDGTITWFWVDLEVVGDVDVQRLAPAAPRMVRALVEAGGTPAVGPTPLTVTPRRYTGVRAGTELAETISAFDRVLPIVVFAEDEERFTAVRHGSYTFDDIVDRAAKRAAGIATVAVVDDTAAAALTEALGDEHGVRSGAFRIYLEDVDPAVRHDGWRHRYVTADRYLGSRTLASAIIASRLGPVSTIVRPPTSFGAAKSLLKTAQAGFTSDDADLLQLAEDEIDELRVRLHAAEEELLGHVLDYEILMREKAEITARADDLKRRLDHAIGQLDELNHYENYWGSPELQDRPPAEASTPSDAILKARRYLSDRLVIPDAALRDVEDLDSAVTAGAWGQRTWEALRALHAYATDLATCPDTRDFWNWCQCSGNPLVWNATSGKLAMQESTVVSTRSKFYIARLLPVATDVHPSGRIYMGSHIKIATGGGNLAPRIYFHVEHDAARVHVGFFGPHKHMPNTRT